MKTKIIAAAMLALFTGTAAFSATSVTPEIKTIKINGYMGQRIDQIISQRVMKEDLKPLVDAFATHNETSRWQTEFWGKWAIGACQLYSYNRDPALYEKIKTSAQALLKYQDKDGYLGNYAPDKQLTQWDIWGRKYTVLGLLGYYELSGDKKALTACCRQVDHLFDQLKQKGISIVETGNYRGMPSASILNAIVKLYKITNNKKYLQIAEDIANELESEKGPQILLKSIEGKDLANRFLPQKEWWNYENGQKAYEMMSCVQGMLDLYEVNNNNMLLSGCTKTVDLIIEKELNIVGSGASQECWYWGKFRQTMPAVHEMETCVTTTWINLLRRMLLITGDAKYADLLETSVYNALLASYKGDGSQVDKYTPLEGVRTIGEEQCGLHINCCNANGPRGFAAIPETAYTLAPSVINVNLYVPSEAELSLGEKDNTIRLVQEGDYPRGNTMSIKVNPAKPARFALRLRIPQWGKATEISLNGQKIEGETDKGYLSMEREWNAGDVVTLKFDMPARMTTSGSHIAITRGPIVFARDSRFADGDVDEVVSVPNKEKIVEATPVEGPAWAWITLKVKMKLGVDYIDHGKPVDVTLCDFGSAGNTWDHAERYRVWLPEVINPRDWLQK